MRPSGVLRRAYSFAINVRTPTSLPWSDGVSVNTAFWVLPVQGRGPAVPALRGPLTGECGWGSEVFGLWCIRSLKLAVIWAGRGRPCLGLGIPRLPDAGGVYLVVASVQACRPIASGSDCMRIHAGTLGTLLREVGCSLSGRDQVFVPGNQKKNWGPHGSPGQKILIYLSNK